MLTQRTVDTQKTNPELTAKQKAWRRKKEALCRLLPVDRLSALPNLPPGMFDPGMVPCPWHDDQRPSCRHWVCDAGYPLWKCYAGCGVKGPLDVVQLSTGYAPFREVWVRAVALAGGSASLAGIRISDEDLERLRPPPMPLPERYMQPGYRAISVDPEAARWLVGRGISPAFVEDHGLAYATPTGHACPGAMVTGKSTWHDDGYKLLFTPINPEGRRATYRARRTGHDTRGALHAEKCHVPAGYRTDGTILVNGPAWRFFVPRLGENERDALAALWPSVPTDAEPLPSALEIAEGEPDWLLRCELAPVGTAVIGVYGGAWCQAFADKIPDGTLVKIYTHSDEAGQAYQHHIATTLRGRCQILVRNQKARLTDRWVGGAWKTGHKLFDEIELHQKLGRADYVAHSDGPENMLPYLPPERPDTVAGRPVVARAEPRAAEASEATPEAAPVEAEAAAPPTISEAAETTPEAVQEVVVEAAAPPAVDTAPAPAVAVPAPPAKKAGRPSVAGRLVELSDAHGVSVAANDKHEIVAQVPAAGGKFAEVPLNAKKFGPLLLAWMAEAGGAPPSKPTVDQAIATLAARVKAQLVGAEPVEAAGELLGLHDADNAVRVERYVTGRALHADEAGWLVLDRGVWARDKKAIVRLATEALRKISEEARIILDEDLQQKILHHATRSLSGPAIKSAIELASSKESISVKDDDLDRDPFLLGVAQGVLDLRTGKLVEHPETARVTRRISVRWDPHAQAPRWERFLDEIFAGNRSVIDFVQRVVGYILTGHVVEQRVVVLIGEKSNNGKSTLLDVLLDLLGDYAHKAGHQIISSARAKGEHKTDRNQMRGRRLTVVDEWPRGAGFDEEQLKSVTGSRKQSGRGISEDESNFRATSKVLIASNNLIEVSSADRAIWRRLLFVPFEQSFEGVVYDGPHSSLLDELIHELPGILAWAARGTAEWDRRVIDPKTGQERRRGIDPPREVVERTDKARADLDDLSRWADACLEFSVGNKTSPTDLAASWASYCESAKVPAGPAQTITSRTASDVMIAKWPDKLSKGRGGSGALVLGVRVRGAVTPQASQRAGSLPTPEDLDELLQRN